MCNVVVWRPCTLFADNTRGEHNRCGLIGAWSWVAPQLEDSFRSNTSYDMKRIQCVETGGKLYSVLFSDFTLYIFTLRCSTIVLYKT